jgi:hypothetical protein
MVRRTRSGRRWKRRIETTHREQMMIKYLVAAVAALVAGVPAALGLVGNASFSRDVPVRVPDQARTVQPTDAATHDANDDHGGRVPRDQRTEPGDDRDARGADDGAHRTRHQTRDRDGADRTDRAGDDRHGEAEPGDDHGGDRDRSGDDSSGRGGSDDGDHGGHGGHGGDD